MVTVETVVLKNGFGVEFFFLNLKLNWLLILVTGFYTSRCILHLMAAQAQKISLMLLCSHYFKPLFTNYQQVVARYFFLILMLPFHHFTFSKEPSL